MVVRYHGRTFLHICIARRFQSLSPRSSRQLGRDRFAKLPTWLYLASMASAASVV